MTKDEALKLALDAFGEIAWSNETQWQRDRSKEAITAIREALAQPEPWEKFCDSNCVWTDHHPDCKLAEQEFVAWEGGEGWESLAWELCADENGEDSCNELIWEGGPIPEPWGDRWMKYEDEAKRLIALVQKHTTPPQRTEQKQQIETLKRCLFQMQEAAKDLVEQAKSLNPPQRTWVGLTEKDILEAAVKSQEGISPRNDTLRFATAIEAKLKEKNGC